MTCVGWKPVSLQDPQPYYPTYLLPSKEELLAMPIKLRNDWRTKAKRLWTAMWQQIWRYQGFSNEQIGILKKLYRDGRTLIFGDEETHPEDYGCNSNTHLKYWNMDIDWDEYWRANKPIWYPQSNS